MRKRVLNLIVCFAIASAFLSGCGSKQAESKIETTTMENTTVKEESFDDSNNVDDIAYDDISYISDRIVQYNAAQKNFLVCFGLQDYNNNYVDGVGTAHIKIYDEKENELYNKDIDFTEEDFTDWTNSYRDESHYYCGLYIDEKDIDGASTTSGKLVLSVSLDNGVVFDEYEMVITNLPEKGLSIKLPKLPINVVDNKYSTNTMTATVEKIEYESSISYDGTAKLTLHCTVKLNSSTKSGSNYMDIGYKLIDEDDIVVDSGTIMTSPISVGEKTVADEYIFDLDPQKEYKLKILDSN